MSRYMEYRILPSGIRIGKHIISRGPNVDVIYLIG